MNNLRKVLATCVMALAMTLYFPPVSSPAETGKTITVKGEVLDSACFFMHKSRGEKHKKCAVDCARKGIPMALIDEKDNVYLLNEDHTKSDLYESLKAHAGDIVTVTGQLVEDHGWKVLFVNKVQ